MPQKEMICWLIIGLMVGVISEALTQPNLKKRPRLPENVFEKDTFRYQKLPYDTVKYEKGELIELLSGAVQAEGFGYDSLVKVTGRNITFKQGNRYVFCDSAYFYPRKNFVKAMGNVQITDDVGSTLSARNMDFDANSGTLMARGDANFTKEQTNVRAPAIDYNINSKIMYYYGGGKLSNAQDELTSETGAYDTNTKNLFARKNVHLKGINEGEPYEIKSDTLSYNDNTKIARILGKEASIRTKDGIIYTNDGEFNTKTKKSKLRGKPRIETDEYSLKGNTIDYDQNQQRGEAEGNVEFFSKKDNVFINADKAKMNGKQGIYRFYGGRAYLRMIDEEKDTLWIVADTLVSIGTKIEDKAEKAKKTKKELQEDSLRAAQEPKMLFAYRNVKIYKSNLQGLCDSLTYNLKDSIIHFYRMPILWSKKNQIFADSLYILTKNNKPDKLIMRHNAFIISKDSAGNFNQIKGKFIDALFKDSKMDKVFVRGNSEAIYYQFD
ncbi:MAG: OstA-like protein, partial [Raineya sp.]|nr:OstA-like protein [Raineya sp.]